MNPTTNSTPPPGLSFGDILFILFRHKWKILTISTGGILGAAALYLFWPVPYQSEARLFIKYVVDTKAPAQGTANDPRIRMPDERTGENVVNTEVEILTSLDLAQKAAEGLTPDVLVKLAGGTNLGEAAIKITKNLLPEGGKKSDVIHVTFKYGDAGVVQPVLRQLINTYLNRHGEIHRALGVFDDFLTKQRDQLKSRLANTERDLRKAKANAHILSIEDSMQSYSFQISKLEQSIMDTGAQLAERQAEVGALTKLLPANAWAAGSPLIASNLPAASSVAAGLHARGGTNLAAAADLPPVASETMDEYKRVCGLLETLSKKQEELSMWLTADSSLAKGVRAQIAANEKAKRKLEEENPGLLAAKALDPRFLAPGSERGSAAAPISSVQMGLIAEMANVPALESRLKVYTNQLEAVQKGAAMVAEAEGTITELERQRLLEEAQYSYFQKNLEELRADEQLSAGKNSNIIPIQTPSPPIRDASKLLKAALTLLFGSIGGAFALAFALEFYVDPSVKRPIEVESRLHLPLFLSIPRLHFNGKTSRHALEAARTPLLPEKSAGGAAPAAGGRQAPRYALHAPWRRGIPATLCGRFRMRCATA